MLQFPYPAGSIVEPLLAGVGHAKENTSTPCWFGSDLPLTYLCTLSTKYEYTCESLTETSAVRNVCQEVYPYTFRQRVY
jgi:hypothetical protein